MNKWYTLTAIAALSWMNHNAFGAQNMTHGAYVRAEIGSGGLMTAPINDVLPAYDPALGLRQDNSFRLGGITPGIAVGYMIGAPLFSYGLELGYYHFTNNHYDAVYGSTNQSLTVTYKGHPINLLAVARYTYNQVLSFYARAGMSYQCQTLEAHLVENGAITQLSHTNKKVLPALGAGLGYHFGQHWEVGANYLHAFGKKSNYQWGSSHLSQDQITQEANLVASSSVASISATYNF